jgi:hypothetical protein
MIPRVKPDGMNDSLIGGQYRFVALRCTGAADHVHTRDNYRVIRPLID